MILYKNFSTLGWVEKYFLEEFRTKVQYSNIGSTSEKQAKCL